MRSFDKTLHLTESELREIKQKTERLSPLADDIKVSFEIVKRADTTAKWGEYCLLMYSEKKPHYLLNAGYMLEQMDLFLSSREIGACWCGLAKAKQIRLDGLDYVIMLAFGKSRPQDFRSKISEFKRKNREEIWEGDFDCDAAKAVRLAPSACNTQPWRIVNNGNCIKVYRNTRVKSFIPAGILGYYNSIDMGICLCFLEIAMLEKGYAFGKTLILEENAGLEFLKIAEYAIK